MVSIRISDWDAIFDEFYAFMYGLDDDTERAIIHYLYKHQGWVSFKQIKKYAMIDSMICLNQSTLSRRLGSLLNFRIVQRRVEDDRWIANSTERGPYVKTGGFVTYYKLSESFYKELSEKKKGKY